jgi:hypothetical protein
MSLWVVAKSASGCVTKLPRGLEGPIVPVPNEMVPVPNEMVPALARPSGDGSRVQAAPLRWAPLRWAPLRWAR